MASQVKKLRTSGPLETFGTGETGIVSVSGIGHKTLGISGGGFGVYLSEDATGPTANTTTTTAAKGSLLIWSNGTSYGLFQSDGSKWQYIVNS